LSTTESFQRNGLIIFGSKIASIFTGLLFLMMVTGWLRPERFGLWEVITDLVTFASYPAGLLGFWASRDVARGKMVGRTLFVFNLLFSSLGFGIYGLFSLPFYSQFSSNLAPLLLAVILVPLAYWNQATVNVALGYKPAAVGYSLLTSEAAKLLVAFPALYIFRLELTGVILALIVSYFVSSLVTTVLVRGATADKLDPALGKKWLKDFWVPGLNLLPAQIAIADTFVASLAAGSTLITGYYQAAFSLGILVSYAGYLASALYPLLVRGGREDAPNITLNLILMFATPMAVGVIVLGPTLLALLSPLYISANANVSLAVSILAVYGFFVAISLFTDSTLMGVEKADLDPDRGIRSYLKSNFLYVSMVNISFLSAILAGVFAVVVLGHGAGLSVRDTVNVWAGLQLGIFVPAVLLKLRKARKKVRISVPKALPFYLLCSGLMAGVLYAILWFGPPAGADRTVIGVWSIAAVGVGSATYFGTLIALDKGARGLLFAVIRSLTWP